MPPDDPVEGLTFNEEELADEDLPSEWPPHIREAFWRCTNAPNYAEAQRETLRFAVILTGYTTREERDTRA